MSPRGTFHPKAVHFLQRGLSLIELVGFIVVMAVVMAGTVSALTGTLQRSATPRELNQGLELAQSRMEIILLQKERLGFAAFTTSFDPCLTATPEACVVPTGYTVSASLAQTFSSSNANFRVIQVEALRSGERRAYLEAVVANY